MDSSLIDLGFDIHVTLFAYLQPEDWDDKEYIPDPEDEKPKVFLFLPQYYRKFPSILSKNDN